jgi:hypothetical protein
VGSAARATRSASAVTCVARTTRAFHVASNQPGPLAEGASAATTRSVCVGCGASPTLPAAASVLQQTAHAWTIRSAPSEAVPIPQALSSRVVATTSAARVGQQLRTTWATKERACTRCAEHVRYAATPRAPTLASADTSPVARAPFASKSSSPRPDPPVRAGHLTRNVVHVASFAKTLSSVRNAAPTDHPSQAPIEGDRRRDGRVIASQDATDGNEGGA